MKHKSFDNIWPEFYNENKTFEAKLLKTSISCSSMTIRVMALSITTLNVI